MRKNIVAPTGRATLGVVVVSFNSADIILDCLESLLAADEVNLRIVVVDNRSEDATIQVLEEWAAGTVPYVPSSDLPITLNPCKKPIYIENSECTDGSSSSHSLVLLKAKVNAGFAAGVNLGLAHLARCPEVDRFWILNPDSVVSKDTPYAFATQPEKEFSLMGGRVIYLDDPRKIQIDGGLINRRTGVTHNKNQYSGPATPPPDPSCLDFISGASMVASRPFYETAGPLPEDYFLYYEEVDWALRRIDLPLAYCLGATIYHRAGTAIGSPALSRPASPFSLYFKHRSRMRFMRRYYSKHLPVAFAYSCAKAAQLALKGYYREAWAVMLGSLNRRPPPYVRALLSDNAARIALPEHTFKE